MPSDKSNNIKIIDGIIQLEEFSPENLNNPNPPADKIYLYAVDKDGKTELSVKKSDGTVVPVGQDGSITKLDVDLANIAGNNVPATGPAWGVTQDDQPVFKPASTGTGTDGWREALVADEDGSFSANIELADVSDIVPPENVLGVRNGKVVLGNGEDVGGIPIDTDGLQLQMAPFVHGLSRDQFRKSVRFTATVGHGVTLTVKSTTGYAVILNHDGTWGHTGATNPISAIKAGNGNPATSFVVTSNDPPNDRTPRFYAIVPCDINGNVDGELTEVKSNLTPNYITTFDGTSLGALTTLDIFSSYLTFFDGAGLGALTALEIRADLIGFNGTELGELTSLDLAYNNLTSFVGTGLGKVTILDLDNNQLITFVGSGLSLATVIIASNNQLTNFDGGGLDALSIINLDNNQLSTFDGTKLGAGLTGIAIRNNQLESIIMGGQDLSFEVSGLFGSNVAENNLDLAALTAFLESLGTTTTGVILYGGNPGSSAFETYLATADDKGYIWHNSLG